MVAKILKYQLFFLFILTVIVFLDFYYQDLFPDNLFSISSRSDSVSFFSYYFTSLIALVGYYTGPWIFFTFIIYSLFFSFLFIRRDYWFDTINLLSLMASTLLLTYLFFPLFIGKGIVQLLNVYFSPITLAAVTFAFIVAFICGAFRSSLKNFLVGLYGNIQGRPLIPRNFFLSISVKNMYVKSRDFLEQGLSRIKISIPSFLKGDSEANQSMESRNPYPAQQECGDEEDAQPEGVGEFGQILTETEEYYYEDGSDHGLPSQPVPPSTAPIPKIDYYQLVSSFANTQHHEPITPPDDGYFERIVSLLENKLNEFKIGGQIVDVLKGPVVDTFLLELGKGVKVSKVTSTASDLSGALYGAPIRIVYPMKGRTSVGIEVPRNPREIIYLDEIISSDYFRGTDLEIPLALGKDAFGEVFVVDLASMPHMLVAGATGSGKSVFINTLLVSLLIKKSPEQLRLILIDPKQLELALYASLPHLTLPVITNAKEASLALLWAVQEMERRYSILKEFGVRNLEGFNNKLDGCTEEMLASIDQFYEHGYTGDVTDYRLPYVVIIVDEFADLILTKAGKEIENNICRLAGKARAAGIHLILATQRPSVDVITGLIKSNFPTRVSFRVSTSIDSRTILSAVGAEKLLGKGDMLYKRGVETVRVHSAFVDENEISALVDSVSQIGIDYDQRAVEFLESGGEGENDPYSFGSHLSGSRPDNPNEDILLSDAINIVVEHRAASASMLQRKLNIGYNRAAKLVETMEERGIVGPAQGAKPRKVLANSNPDFTYR